MRTLQQELMKLAKGLQPLIHSERTHTPAAEQREIDQLTRQQELDMRTEFWFSSNGPLPDPESDIDVPVPPACITMTVRFDQMFEDWKNSCLEDHRNRKQAIRRSPKRRLIDPVDFKPVFKTHHFEFIEGWVEEPDTVAKEVVDEPKRSVKLHSPRPDEGTKRDVDKLGRIFRLLNAEQKRDACEHIAHLAGCGLTTEAVLANTSTIVTTLLVESKERTHKILNEIRQAAGRPDLTPAERQQGFAEHDKLKERLAAIITDASRCRYAEMSVSELIKLAIASSATEAEIRRELIAFGTSAANSGTRKREALTLFHSFVRELEDEHARRIVDTSGELEVDSNDLSVYQGTVPDDGIEL